jgi:hypothetical protein
MTFSDVIFQIILALVGALIGISVPFLEDRGKKWAAAIIAISLLIASSVWIGYEYGIVHSPNNGGEAASVNNNPCETFDLQILSPKEGEIISGETSIMGTFENIPTADDFQLFVRTNSQPYEYWPKGRVFLIIDTDKKTWEWTGDLGITQDSSTIIVSVIGNAGRALTDYFVEVGYWTGLYPGIKELTPDIIECDRITVIPGN